MSKIFSIAYGVISLFLISCTSTSEKETAGKKDSVATTTIQQPQSDYLITETRIDKIDSNTNLLLLQQFYGAGNIKDTVDFGPEGTDSLLVTKIFPNSPKEITVYWKNNEYHKAISGAEVSAENAPYHTTDNLKAGSTLQQLVSINTKKIKFYGTGWDYGGFITSYNKGKFETSPLSFQLAGKENLDEKLMGDKQLDTDMPLVKNNLDKIIIYKISLSFEKNAK